MSRLFSLFWPILPKKNKKIFFWWFFENFCSRLGASSRTWGSIFVKISYDCPFDIFEKSQKSCEKLKIEHLAKNVSKSAFLWNFSFSPISQICPKSVQLLIFCAFPRITNHAKSKIHFFELFCKHFVKFCESQCVPSFFSFSENIFSCFSVEIPKSQTVPTFLLKSSCFWAEISFSTEIQLFWSVLSIFSSILVIIERFWTKCLFWMMYKYIIPYGATLCQGYFHISTKLIWDIVK